MHVLDTIVAIHETKEGSTQRHDDYRNFTNLYLGICLNSDDIKQLGYKVDRDKLFRMTQIQMNSIFCFCPRLCNR